MGSDYYCFVCGTGFHVPYEIRHGERHGEDEDEDDDDETGDEAEEPSLSRRFKELFSTEIVAERLQWLSSFRTIGRNRNAPGLTQCYLSGPAEEEDFGQADIENGEHPNAQNLPETLVSCYIGDDMDIANLPVHDSCFAILCKVFARAKGAEYHWTSSHKENVSFPFDLDPLFSCVSGIGGCLPYNLDQEQYFAVEWSQLYDYFEPIEDPDLRWSAETTAEPDRCVPKQYTESVLDTLPHELLTQILDLTSQADLVPLIKASRAVRSATDSNKFWQHRLKIDAPWLWESFDKADTTNHNWQEYYNAVMMQVHQPLKLAERGVHVSGLANRRRIWRICEQILQIYLKTNTLQLQEKPSSIFEDGVVSRYLPIVANHQDPQLKGDASFFFKTPSDMHSTKHIILKWSELGALCGISVTAGAEEATFGDTDCPKSTETAMEIQPGDWIEKLVLNITAIQTWKTSHHYGEQTYRRLAVTGVAVCLLSQTTTLMGQEKGCKRLLEPLPRNGIVGFKSQYVEGRITHLGLLEHPADLTTPRPPDDSQRHALLWDGHLPSADLQFQDYLSGYWSMQNPWDLVPMQTLIFGATDLEQSTMIGFGASASLQCLEIYRSNGSCEQIGPVKGAMKIFRIDGPGGERIAGIDTAVGALPTGLTLVTTYGRQAVFGKREDNGRSSHTSSAGSVVAGIYCSFEYGARQHDLMSSIGLIRSPHIDRAPMDAHRLENARWEPRPPPSSWHTVGRLYGPEHRGTIATYIEFSRPVAKIEGLFPAPDWLDVIEIGGFRATYSDNDSLDPVSYFGFSPHQWPTGEIATPENLRNMKRYPGMSMSCGRLRDSGKAHVLTDEEALDQPTTWDLGPGGERIVAVTVWASDYLNGLQFHSDSGKISPRWGKCGGEPSGTIRAGGEERIVGLKVILGSSRLDYNANTQAPQAVEVLSDAPQ